ncbi:MAG: DUF6514 family protein [Bacillota bacterium]|nr:DUF6514 family protein [Bacillota bacterium]
MLCKYLEKTVRLLPDENEKEFGNMIELDYYLMESNSALNNESTEEKVYGIEIVKKENSKPVENDSIRDISIYRDNTRYILDKLADNIVTPMELKYILDDIIGVWG